MDRKGKNQKKWIWLGLDGLWVLALILFDQYTKSLATKFLKDNSAMVIWDKVFQLEYLENRGSAFGLFENKRIFLLIVGILFMGIIIALLIKVPTNKRFIALHVLLGCLIAGGMGNMIDRFVQGYVVDFFYFILIHFPIFNVADVYIVVSVILIGFMFAFVYQEEELTFLMGKKETK